MRNVTCEELALCRTDMDRVTRNQLGAMMWFLVLARRDWWLTLHLHPKQLMRCRWVSAICLSSSSSTLAFISDLSLQINRYINNAFPPLRATGSHSVDLETPALTPFF